MQTSEHECQHTTQFNLLQQKHFFDRKNCNVSGNRQHLPNNLILFVQIKVVSLKLKWNYLICFLRSIACLKYLKVSAVVVLGNFIDFASGISSSMKPATVSQDLAK